MLLNLGKMPLRKASILLAHVEVSLTAEVGQTRTVSLELGWRAESASGERA